MKLSETERFWAKVDLNGEGGCWLWTAATSRGYGRFTDENGRQIAAHRWGYTRLVGPIPEGLVLDHLCRVRNCVRPEHLEVVTERENILRGVGLAAIAAKKEQCPSGHPYNESNTRISPDGWRQCRVCDREQTARRRARA